MISIVPDTNTIISGFLFQGNESKIFEKAEEKKLQLFLSDEILHEPINVINRPKFKTTPKEIEDIVNKLIRISAIVKPTQQICIVKDDPTDNKFIECAIEAKANYIISGDRHLLKIKKYKGVKILKTKEILEILQTSKEDEFWRKISEKSLENAWEKEDYKWQETYLKEKK